MKGALTIDFLEKYLTWNSASYCQILRKNLPYLLNDPRVCMCVCVCKASIIFTNPSAQAGYDTTSIFEQSVTGLNSEFSFS